jgi:predicted phosphodiesterase
MPKILWDETELSILLEHAHKGYQSSYIQQELARNGYSRSVKAIINKVYEVRSGRNRSANVKKSLPLSDTASADGTAIQAIAKARDAATLGLAHWHAENSRTKLTRATKILSLSDLHFPFFYADAIEHALAAHADADIVVINGDLLEVDMASKYPRQKTILLKYEYKLGLDFLRRLAEEFPRVVVVKGNHEYRLDRYFQSRIEPGMNFIVEGDILWRMCEGYGFDEAGNFEKQYDLSNVSYSRGLTNWFVQIGQCIFCHPWRTSSLSIKSVEIAHQWFSERGFSYQAIMMGHTHRLGKHITAGKLLIEQGCLCVPLEYAARADIRYRPTTFGYGVVILDKHGNVDFNESDAIYYGTGSTTPTHVVKEIPGSAE